jgi:DNA-binding CsgD family transcriptional regulator
MGIGLGTVKSHLHALYAIMGVTSRSEAIVKSKRWMI